MIIRVKSEKEIQEINKAFYAVLGILSDLGDIVKAGITTDEINDFVRTAISENDCGPAFLGLRGFPKESCISVNDVIVHGISNDYVLKDGDILTVDVGVKTKSGWYGDSAEIFTIGSINENTTKLIDTTRQALFGSVEAFAEGKYLYDAEEKIASYAKKNGFGIIRNYSGHGIGKSLHERPSIYNYQNTLEQNVMFENGMVLCIEPMFTLGGDKTQVDMDNWTVRTKDGSIAAHFERGVAIWNSRPIILGEKYELDL